MKRVTFLILTLMCHDLLAVQVSEQGATSSFTFWDFGMWTLGFFGALIFLFTVRLMPALRRTKFLLYTLTVLSAVLLIAARTIN